MNSVTKVGVKYPVTPEMIEAGDFVMDRLGVPHTGPHGISRANILHDVYITMRALEPGTADPGVTQQPYVSPYKAR